MNNKDYKLLFLSLFLMKVCSAQISDTAFDNALKREIAAISTLSSSAQSKTYSVGGYNLLSIPLKKCTDSSVFFVKGNLYAIALEVRILGERTSAGMVISSIDFFHNKYMLDLPDSVFTGLKDINFCLVNSTGKNPGSSDCKAFYSADKRRVYIYMLNGKGASRYEVIWVIKDSKYHSRIINPVPEV
jgi:hypothetical protein